MAFNDTKSPGDIILAEDWNDFVDYTEGISGQLALHTSNNNIHLTPEQKSQLTGGGDTSLHYHSADRDLSNATGVLDISHGGTNNTSFSDGYFIAYDGTKLASTSYNSSSFAPASHTHDASDITSGTLSTARFSAYDDLVDENKIGSGSDQVASGSHLHDDRYYTKSQCDENYFPSSTGHDHITNTSNPHNVTYSQVGAIQDANDTVKSSHIDWGTGTNQVSLDDVPDGTTYGKLTITQRDDLTDGGDSSLHYHSSDRDLSNATGILSIDHGGTNNSSFTTGKFIAYDGSKLASTSYDEDSFAPAAHTHDASDINSGTLAYERGGLNADVSSFDGLVKIAGGSTSYVTDNSANWNTAYDHSQDSSIHLTATQKDALTGGGDTDLHYHSSDRDLSNATGILAVSNGGTNNSSFTADKFLVYDSGEDKIKSSSYDASSFASATHTHALSDLSDTSIDSEADGHTLTYLDGSWQNTLPPLTFASPAVGLKGNRYIRLARFKLPSNKSFYLWQACISDVDGNSVADLRIELLSGSTVVYSTSSNVVKIGNPLASVDAGSNVTIRIIYSGASVSDDDDVKCLGFMAGSII